MGTITESLTSVTTIPLLSNASLLVGSHDHVQTQVINELQRFLCTHQGCKTCLTCVQISNLQHHAIIWCTPTANNYTLADIDALLEQIKFALDADQHVFIVIAHADRLPPACANRLLKTLEEPAPGYHFILCTQSAEAILPTIQSRCIIQHFDHAASTPALWDYFVTAHADPVSFLQALQTTQMTEHELYQLINELSVYWNKKYLECIKVGKSTELVESKLDILNNALQQQLAPGSSKIVLRNLYLLLQG